MPLATNTTITGYGRTMRPVIVASLLIAALILFLFDPEKGGFPGCPFRSLTGLLCPGCGSQRAVHDILHLRMGQAFKHNALLVSSVPILIIQCSVGSWGKRTRTPSGSNYVVYVWLVAILTWAVLRNGIEI